ncbi:MAG: rod shape-determining protein MreC [Gemmatimonadota bacterium]|jgi:rod shape-determining protein MreC
MASYTEPPEEGRGRRDLTVAFAFLFLAAVALYLPAEVQSQVAEGLRATVLRPFILTQKVRIESKNRAEDALDLHAQLDSLGAIVASQASLLEENRRLRQHLELEERAPGTFVHANVIRPGTSGTESMFLLDVGSEQGVQPGDPVLMRTGRIGLVGVIREVSAHSAIGLDWSHPDFRASAMTADGEVPGLVEPRRGDFRGGDRLLLNAIPYYERLDPGTLIVTSGLGGIFPRGIPVGEVLELHQDFGDWRSEYWLRPVVETGKATHVLVVTGDTPSDQLTTLLEGGGEEGREAGGEGEGEAGGQEGGGAGG